MKQNKKITKEQLYKIKRKMYDEELIGYFDKTKKSHHIFKSKKEYCRKEKYKKKYF